MSGVQFSFQLIAGKQTPGAIRKVSLVPFCIVFGEDSENGIESFRRQIWITFIRNIDDFDVLPKFNGSPTFIDLFPMEGGHTQGIGRCTDSSLGFERVMCDLFSLETGRSEKRPVKKVTGNHFDWALVEIVP